MPRLKPRRPTRLPGSGDETLVVLAARFKAARRRTTRRSHPSARPRGPRVPSQPHIYSSVCGGDGDTAETETAEAAMTVTVETATAETETAETAVPAKSAFLQDY